MSERQDLEKKIEEKEAQLSRAQQESDAWNKGQYKRSSNAQISKILVEKLRNELDELRSELESL